MEILNVITHATWNFDDKTQGEGLVKEVGEGRTRSIGLLQGSGAIQVITERIRCRTADSGLLENCLSRNSPDLILEFSRMRRDGFGSYCIKRNGLFHKEKAA
jgi:hypothetical protein